LGGPPNGNFEILWKEDSGKAASLFLGELCYGEPGGGTPLMGQVKEGSGDGHLSPRGPHLGKLEGSPFTEDFERWMKEGSRSVVSLSLSLREPCEGNLEGGLLYWGLWRICTGRLWRRASVSIGAQMGNLEGGSFTRDFERWMKEGSRSVASLSLSLSEGAL
jgi:hypothetical protein